MDENLIAAVAGRVRGFREDHDPGQVAGFEALKDAMRLAGAMAGGYLATGELNLVALQVVMEMFVARAETAADDEGREAEMDRLRFFLQPVAAGLPEPLREALGVSPEPSVDFDARYQAGMALLVKANSGDKGAIDGAVATLNEVVGLMSPDSPGLPTVLSNLGIALKLRYEQTDAEEDLTMALSAAQAALGLQDDGAKTNGYGLHQAGYGELESMAFRRTGDKAHAAAAVRAYHTAREILPREHPDGPAMLHNSLLLLLALIKDFGDMEFFDEAVEAARAELGQADDAQRPGRLNTLAIIYQDAFDRTRDMAFLDTATEYFEQALALMPPGHEYRAATLTNVNLNLRFRYEMTGDAGYLDRAIATGREAVAAGPEGHPDLSMYLNGLHTLSIALRSRFALTGDLPSLEEAIELGRTATRLAPPGASRAAYLNSLSHALRLRHDRVDSAADLDAAVEAARSAVSEFPAQSQERAPYLGNLAASLGWLDTPAALDEAVDALREGRGLLPADHPHWHLCSANLCAMLRSRYQLTQRPDDLAEAIAVGRETMAAASIRLHEATAQINLGLALAASHRLDGDPATLAEALRLLRDGAGLVTQRPSLRLQFAEQWAVLAAETGDWAQAARAFELAVELNVRLAARHLRRADLEHQLTSERWLTADAAGCAVRAGKPSLAMRVLEQGRGVMLSQTLDLRGDMSELEAQAPDLAARFRAIGSALEGTQPRSRTGTASDAEDPADGDHRAALARDWDALLADIRSRPGLENFLGSPDEAELRAAAAGGPIVVVNMSRHGSAAVIVTADGVAAVPLPGLSVEAYFEYSTRFLAASSSLTGRPGDPARDVVMDTMAWLWEVIARPVLDFLGLAGRPAPGREWPRLWWSPTGLLSLLPLHMAGRHDGTSDNVLDRVICSYTPTVRMLRHAQTRAARGGGPLSATVIALAATPGLRDLPGAGREARLVAARFPGTVLLEGAQATREHVLDVIPHARWAHFACHAGSSPLEPGAARIYLHDGPLDLSEISRLRVDDAEFAYLAACETARGSIPLADEAIHVASAFQLAGYRHVVAAQWPLADEIALAAAGAIYRRIGPLGDRTALDGLAVATHAAILELRDAYPFSEQYWGAFIHIGP